MSHEIPEHIIEIYGSARAFKVAKRRELRVLLRALYDLQLGSAYTPIRGTIVTKEQIEGWIKACSVARWGRYNRRRGTEP